MKNRKQFQKLKAKRIKNHLEQVNLFAAGIDIGSHSHFVAVPEALDSESVREFPSFTGDLNTMADWLISRLSEDSHIFLTDRESIPII